MNHREYQNAARTEILRNIAEFNQAPKEVKTGLGPQIITSVEIYLKAEAADEVTGTPEVTCLQRTAQRLMNLSGIENDAQRALIHSTLKDIESTLKP